MCSNIICLLKFIKLKCEFWKKFIYFFLMQANGSKIWLIEPKYLEKELFKIRSEDETFCLHAWLLVNDFSFKLIVLFY